MLIRPEGKTFGPPQYFLKLWLVASGLLSLCPRFNLRIWLPAWSYSERQAVIFWFSFPYHRFEFDFEFSLFRFHSFPLLTLPYITIAFVFSFRFEA